MIMYILTGLVFTLTVGFYLALCLTSIFTKNFTLKRWIIIVIISMLIGFGITGAIDMSKKSDTKNWNNGNCPTCETEWELIDVVHLHYGENNYYWSCPKCKEIIKTNTMMK